MDILLPLARHGLVYGLILTVALITLTAVCARLNPGIFAGDYPPDIKAKFGPLDARTQRQKQWVAAALVLVMVVILGAMVAAMPAAGLAPSFINVFAVAFIAAFTFNLFDLLVLDWLVFCTWQPSFIVLPGTAGMAGYRDYRFHFHGFLLGLRFCFAAGLFTGLVTLGVMALSALGR